MVHHYSSTLALGIMRVMGWFPYRLESSAPLQTVKGWQEKRVPWSRPWLMWSLGVGPLSVLLCGSQIYFGFQVSLSNTIPTLVATRRLYGSFWGVTGFFTCLYALVYSPRLAMVASHANHISRDLEFRSFSLKNVLILLLNCAHVMQILALCSIEAAIAETFSGKAFASSINHLFKNMYTIMTTILYNNCIHILTASYSKVTERITRRECTIKYGLKKSAAFTPTHEAPQDLTEDDFDDIGRQILHLQAFHNQINSYFAPVVVMTVLSCMFTTILTVFYFSLFPYLSLKTRVFNCIYIYLSMQPLFILTNISHDLNAKVNNKNIAQCQTIP